MRAIVNLSLPPTLAEMAKKRAKEYGFASVSEYIRVLINLDEGLISPQELLAISGRAMREYHAGKLKERGSLAELL